MTSPWRRCRLAGLGVLVLLVAGTPGAARAEAGPLRVLFLGNSLTHYHELPEIVAWTWRAAGHERPIEVARIAPGGESFQRHSERRGEGSALATIARGWDVVVLQENGRLAARPRGSSLTFASRLVKAARDAGARPLFYMTWAYRASPESHVHMRRTYDLLSERLDVPVAPVGEAWKLARETAPRIELFDPDGIHPSAAGSYLAACVLYAALSGDSPVGVPPPTRAAGAGIELAAAVARRLQEIAWRTVEAEQTR